MCAFHVEPRPITRINTCFDTSNAHITTNYGRISFVFVLHNQSYLHRILVTISTYAGVHTMLRTQPNSCWKADTLFSLVFSFLFLVVFTFVVDPFFIGCLHARLMRPTPQVVLTLSSDVSRNSSSSLIDKVSKALSSSLRLALGSGRDLFAARLVSDLSVIALSSCFDLPSLFLNEFGLVSVLRPGSSL
jgi:hypothetical protein